MGDFPDVIPLAQLTDELLDKSIVDDVALRGVDIAALRPLVIRHMVAPNAQGKRFLRQPEEGHDRIRLLLMAGREHQHQRRQVGGAGQVKPGVAGAAFQLIRVNHAAAFIPLVHGHPANRLLHPLIQAQLTKLVLIGGRFLRFMKSVAHLIEGDGMSQRRIRLVPIFLARPVRVVRQTKDHRIEAGIDLPAFQHVQRFLVYLPADAVAVGARCRQKEPQRLLSRIAGALGHYVIKGSGRLGVQLVEDAGADVQAMLGGHLRGKHLIDAAGGLVHHALHGRNDLDPLAQRRGLLDHIDGHIKNNGRLLPVAGAGVHLGLPLVIVGQHIERDGRAELALALLFGNLDIGGGVLTHGGIIVPYRSKHVPDDLLLPRQQLEGLPMKFALGMLQAFDKAGHAPGLSLVKHRRSTRPSAASPWGHRRRCRPSRRPPQ